MLGRFSIADKDIQLIVINDRHKSNSLTVTQQVLINNIESLTLPTFLVDFCATISGICDRFGFFPVTAFVAASDVLPEVEWSRFVADLSPPLLVAGDTVVPSLGGCVL